MTAGHRAVAAAEPDDALAGLRRFAATDNDRVASAVAAAGVTGWSYYFPYLHFFSQLSGRERLLFEEAAGALLVYRVKRDGARASLSLLVPPFPFVPAALDHANARMAAANADGRQRIARVPEELAAAVARHGFTLRFNADEYVYDANQVRALEGAGYASLRRKLSHPMFQAAEVRPYSAADRAACETLLDSWRRGLAARGVRVGPYRSYARHCLAQGDRLLPAVLRGQVIEIDGTVAAFTFGGPIDAQTASMFITVSDHAYPGLAYLQRHRFIRDQPLARYWNDAFDSGRPGLAQMKRSFRPVRMHPVFSARRGATGGAGSSPEPTRPRR